MADTYWCTRLAAVFCVWQQMGAAQAGRCRAAPTRTQLGRLPAEVVIVSGIGTGRHQLEAVAVVLQRLKGGEWFTTRVSACSLFAATYPPVSGDTAIAQELCSMFRDLCRDETPMVRRAAASNIGALAAAVDTRTAQQVRRILHAHRPVTHRTACHLHISSVVLLHVW